MAQFDITLIFSTIISTWITIIFSYIYVFVYSFPPMLKWIKTYFSVSAKIQQSYAILNYQRKR